MHALMYSIMYNSWNSIAIATVLKAASHTNYTAVSICAIERKLVIFYLQKLCSEASILIEIRKLCWVQC